MEPYIIVSLKMDELQNCPSKNKLVFTTGTPINSRDISVDIALRYGLDDRGFRFDSRWEGWEFFSSSSLPERLWGPPSLLSNGYQGIFPWR
jgi:hypothetical protein